MNALTVIPIESGVFKETLTYFSKNKVSIGSLVEISIRNKKTVGLVIKSVPASSIKSELKASDFSLKKVSKVITKNFFTPEYIKTILKSADEFATNPGMLIKSTTPKYVLDNLSEFSSKTQTKRTSDHNEKYAIQDTFKERLSYYRALVREEFAKNKSIIICTPTAYEAEKIYHEINRGVENYSILLHNKLKNKEIKENWQNTLKNNHPLLIVLTPLFLSLPKRDIGMFILEQENNTDYFSLKRPFVDYRLILEIMAESHQAKLIKGDIFLSCETIKEVFEKEILVARPLKYRLLPSIKTSVIDMKTDKKELTSKLRKKKKDDFSVFSPEVKNILSNIDRKKSRKAFLITNRKGVATTTVCNDCNTLVSCPHCKRPLVLHDKAGNKALYMCHACQEEYKSEDKCQKCLGWRLTPLGIGTETILKELKTLYPDLPTFIIDNIHTKTKKEAQTELDKFLEAKSGVLIGTDMALRYLKEEIDYAVVISMDSSFAIPDFRMREKILKKIFSLKELTERELIIQTRLPKEKIFDYATSANLANFYREELQDRESFKYPPYAVLIKISRTGTEKAVEEDVIKINKLFKNYSPLSFPALNKIKDRNKITVNTLLKIDVAKWPEHNIVEVLKSLPPRFVVAVRPADIL